jgi:hypothetical protein
VYPRLPFLSDTSVSRRLGGKDTQDVQDYPEVSGDDDDTFSVGSDDSYEKVCNENWTGELLNMYEDLRLN